MDQALYRLAARVGRELKRSGLMMAAAESCTGGWIGQAVTMVPGSSEWFERGFVTYTYISKREMLGVKAASLARHGAVSEQVVREMVLGALSHSHAQVSVAVSGVAGPGGGTPDKPVGTVCFGWARAPGRDATMKASRIATSNLRGVSSLTPSPSPGGRGERRVPAERAGSWIAVVETRRFRGDRDEVRRRTVIHALRGILTLIA